MERLKIARSDLTRHTAPPSRSCSAKRKTPLREGGRVVAAFPAAASKPSAENRVAQYTTQMGRVHVEI